ncbi:MAG: proprotein convertase P-domain-containing protein [Planctomycetota bacterium]|nr:proprotein convertase P-domain-containing protein [Planctomycetota bacterium]
MLGDRRSAVWSFACSLLSVALGSVVPAAPSSGPPAGTTVGAGDPEVEYVAPGPLHRVLVSDAAFEILLARDAVRAAEDYGSFRLVLADARFTGGVAGLRSTGARIADELTLVDLNGFRIDGARGGRVVAGGSLQGLEAPGGPPADGESRLRLVQFAGPVREEWLAALEATGTHVVTYAAHDAYVVKGGPEADARVTALAGEAFVLAVSSFEPAYKLRPELRAAVDFQSYAVTVQVIADAEGEDFARRIGRRAIRQLSDPEAVLAYWNVRLVLDGANVHELARDPRVFAIEPLVETKLLDERQGQIVAGNLDPAGIRAASATYLAWLASKGFPGTSNPFAFAVDVVDDGVDRGSTSDVNVEFRVGGSAAGASRIAYNHNYSGDALADGRAGHGNINASIVGGYNASAGTNFEDSAGFQYGLGIAPWVGLGNTKVFSNSGAGVFSQPTGTRLGAAYAAGARISSNSWGATSGTGYDTDSQAHDAAVRDAQSGVAGNQELTIVFAAGNDGSAASTVRPPGTAKNVITVGAGENWRPTGTDGCGFGNSDADDARDVATFSSRGPTSDARRKPEILGPGTHVQGAASRAAGYDGTGVCDPYFPGGQTLYAWSSGTSHSTPAVAGACALVRQWFANNGLGTPSPAMQKAFLVSSAAYMSGVGANDTLWSNSQGMGRVDLGRAFDSAPRIRVDQSQVLGSTGSTYVATGTIASNATPFRVVLAWTDAPGATTGNAFVNNLDLEVTVNGVLYRGNVYSGAYSASGGAADARNNLESVFLPAGASGPFSVVVRATNIAGDGVPGNADTTDQDFALVVYNGSAPAPTPDFGLSASPASGTVTQGASTSTTITVTRQSGFSGAVKLQMAPAIAGLTGTFSVNPVTGASSKLTLTAGASAPAGIHVITVSGTSGVLTRSTTYALTIQPASDTANRVRTFSIAPNLAVPDNDANGVTSTIQVPDSLTVASLAVATVIPHPYEGDLVVSLVGPDGTTRILHNRTGGSADDVTTSFAIVTSPHQSLSAFVGKNTSGAWRLRVQDLAGSDVGTLSSWRITFNGESSVAANLPVPDNNTTGVTSTLDVTRTGTVASVQARVHVAHPYRGDLEVALIGPDGTLVLLHNRTGGSADDVNTEYPELTVPNQSLAAFAGKAIQGVWRLRVRDLASSDTGTLVGWTLSIHATTVP